jgi:SAM-dependent methyltransferase
VEPDPSLTIGAGAILALKQQLRLDNLHVVQAWGESLPLESASFDVCYIRQAMHHAHELDSFIKEAARLIKPGGILFTLRDHVIYDAKDKEWFLQSHPLHKFYGGENAFTESEYDAAITGAGLLIEEKLHHYDSVINYFPEKRSVVEGKMEKRENLISASWHNRIPKFLHGVDSLKKWFYNRAEAKLGPVFDASRIPGRHIAYVARKPL